MRSRTRDCHLFPPTDTRRKLHSDKAVSGEAMVSAALIVASHFGQEDGPGMSHPDWRRVVAAGYRA